MPGWKNSKFFFINLKKKWNSNILTFQNENNNINFSRNTINGINYNIYSIYFSKNRNQIFICLINEKKVLIFNFNEENKIGYFFCEIYDNKRTDLKDFFYKSIDLEDDKVAITERGKITFWAKKNVYKKYKTISFLNSPFDILLIINLFIFLIKTRYH